MLIDVRPASSRLLKRTKFRFALQRDGWNDHGFSTLYHLYIRTGEEETDLVYVGGLKILKKGQTEKDAQFIREPFERLSSEFASVGNSLDYYQRLNEIDNDYKIFITEALRDVVANPALVNEFKEERGWEISLFRDNPEWDEFLTDARTLYDGNFGALPDLDKSFKYTPPGADTAIEFDFGSPEPNFYFGPYRHLGPSHKRVLLPDRIIVMIGRNGSGKSTLLSRIAHVAFASPQERASERMKAMGALEPSSLGFMRVITISYSAFDSFVVPGFAAKDLAQMTEDVESGEGRFVFCGLRDLVAESRDDIRAAERKSKNNTTEKIEINDRRTSTRLKSVDSLAAEFFKLIERIIRDDQLPLFRHAMEPLMNDPSFIDLKAQFDYMTRRPENAIPIFLNWSTGHKIALHVVASLVASARPRSLILFDEPEAHLHPPLMAALMHSIRIVLTHINAFCIVATHSPVLLQETLSRHVRLVRRTGDALEIGKPKLETFGENIGILTYDAFGLTASSTDYHKVLDLLVKGCDGIEEIDEVFDPGLSAQARAYVMSRLAKKS